jgi:hypothetical protein
MVKSATDAKHAMGTAVLALGALAWLGCDAAAAPVVWELSFVDDQLAQQAVRVEGSVLIGGCEGDDLLYRVRVGREHAPPAPPELGPGRYGFAAMARDAECRTIARGCVELTLPEAAAVVHVQLHAVAEEAGCEALACEDGLCSGEAPPPDAGALPQPDAGSGGDEPDCPPRPNPGRPDC